MCARNTSGNKDNFGLHTLGQAYKNRPGTQERLERQMALFNSSCNKVAT